MKPSNCLTRLLLDFYLNLYTNKINDDLQVKDFSPSNCNFFLVNAETD